MQLSDNESITRSACGISLVHEWSKILQSKNKTISDTLNRNKEQLLTKKLKKC